MNALISILGYLAVLALALGLVALWAAVWGVLWAGVSLWQLFEGRK